MTRTNFDVVVVGGGPAGLSAAAAAAEKKLKVAIVEKDPSIAQTVRTSGVTWFKDVGKLGIPRHFYNPLRRFRVCSPNKEHILESSEAEACVLDIRGLYHYLACQAAALGAEIFLGSHVSSACYENDKTAVRVSVTSPRQLEFRGSVVIDASGFSSVVGKSLGMVEEWQRIGVGAEYEAYAEKVEVDTAALMVGREYSPAGYAWIFPVAENRVRIGVGIGRPESAVDPLRHLLFLLEKRPGPLMKLGRICPVESHLGVVPNEGPRKCTAMHRVLLVGDSAGQINPLVLEGIRFAIKFGRIAGEAAGRAIDKGDSSDFEFEEYEKKWKKDVWNNFQVGLSVQRKWLDLSDEKWDHEVSIFDSLSVKKAIELFQCQFSTRKLVTLAADHPELLKSQSFPAIMKAKMRRGFSVK